jgi:hypothetical protein
VTKEYRWVTRGFDDFRAGTFGNGGQNIYISRAGVLQRIHHYDFNGNGYLDLVFCNSQNHWERASTTVYTEILAGAASPVELPAEGAWSGAIADLNGDGYDDLIIANWYNGIRRDLNATIYYGSLQGWSERRQQHLPAPLATSVATGDFNGDGRPDLAFISNGRLRLFYQGILGFEPKRFVDLEITGQQAAAADLDGDGHADLAVRSKEGTITLYWGGVDGISAQRATPVPPELSVPTQVDDADPQAGYAEHVEDAHRLLSIVHLAGQPHLFVAQPDQALLLPILADRTFGRPLTFACRQSYAVAAGDIDGNGVIDLVFACREGGHGDDPHGNERSWIYWGGPDGYSEERRTPLASCRACDVAVVDLDGDGCAEVLLCQGHTSDSYTTQSLIYQGRPNGISSTPVAVTTHDARRVLTGAATGDGSLHVAFVNFYSRNRLGNIDPSIYWGGPQGFSPTSRQDLPGWGAVEAIGCDIDDNGRPDLILANASENSVDRDPGSYILINGPDGFPTAPSLVLPTVRSHGVCCADLNRNGYLDLIFCGFHNPELLIFYGSDSGYDTANPQRIRLEYDGVVYDEPRWIYLADLNNNGWLDLIVPQIAYDRSLILWGGPDGFSMERCQPLSVVRGACARAADLTGNGYLDLIIGGHMPALDAPHDSFAYVYWNGPDGLREENRTLLPAKTINSMAVADFNNDGLLDLFICSYHGGIERDVDSYIYWNRAERGFSAADRTRLFTHSASGCVAADFNGDGWIDLAIANHKVNGDHVGFSAVWWNGPDGFDEKRLTRLPTSGPHGMMAVEPASIRDRGPIEEYISIPYQLPGSARLTAIGWQAETPPRGWVHAQIRWAGTREALDAAAWTGPDGEGSWYTAAQPIPVETAVGGWIQYRLALGALNGCGSPRVQEVVLTYVE